MRRAETAAHSNAASAKLDTYREQKARFSGLRTRDALLKQRRSTYRNFAAHQLKTKLVPIIPGLLD